MSEISIIPFENIYQQDVVDLILNIQQNEFGVPVTLEGQPDLMDIPGFYQVKNGNFWLALREGKVVGSIALLDIGHAKGALRKMFVDARYRGKEYGIGQRLLDTLVTSARERGFRVILLGTTEKFLAAHRFYEKNGFDAIAKSSLPQEFPVMSVDKIFYSLTLT